MRIVAPSLVAALLALAGCSAAAPPTTAATTAAAAEPTNPLAAFPINEQTFIQRAATAGFSFGSGNADLVAVGQYLCGQMRAEERPALTYQTLTSRGLTQPQAEQFYTMAHDTLCPGYSLPNPNTFGEGTYEVGVDIPPGKYRSPGGSGCYWERQDKNGEILDNDLSDGPTVLTVQASDAYVKLSSCTWTKA